MTFADFVTSLAITLTPAQRVLARVAFDGVEPRQMRGESRRIARQLFGDIDTIPLVARAVMVWVVGARSGKSWLSALRLLHLALTCDLSRLAAGEIAVGLICAPDLKLARQTLRFASGAVLGSRFASCVVGQTADSITIRRHDGRTVSIEALPASRGGSSLRGRTLIGAVLDECAFFLSDEYVVNDQEILAAVSPRILPDGQVLIPSTPWTKSGLLYELFSQNFGAPSSALAATASTLLMRDHDEHTTRIVTRERLRDPENAQREYEAIFTDGAGTLLTSADVDASVDPVRSRPPRSSCVYGMAIDVGLRHDATAIVVFHVEDLRREDAPPLHTLIVDATARLLPQPSQRVRLEDIEHTIATLADSYNVSRVFGDVVYADAIGPFLRARGIRFEELSVSSPAQERRAMSCAARFSSRAIKLVDDPFLIRELKDLKVTRHSGGRVSIAAPESKRKFDDMADALLLACEVATSLPTAGGNIECRTSVSINEGGLQVESLWRERREKPDGSGSYWVPSGPPIGSPAWSALRREQKQIGISIPGEPDPDDFDGINVRVY